MAEVIMQQPIVFTLPDETEQASRFAQAIDAKLGELELRQFPDGESYLRVLTEVSERPVIIFCNLNNPDTKTLRLLFLAATLRELGAASIGLIAPYLAYMRQDARFKSGECISSRPYADLISNAFDYLITVDPHLHRYHALEEIYTLPCDIVHAADAIGRWVCATIEKPLLIGPDQESEQWVRNVSKAAGAPYQILSKTRYGDRDVKVSLPDLEPFAQFTPVVLDDIISSGQTMLETLTHLRSSPLSRPCVIAIHALFDDIAWQALSEQAEVVSCETVRHPSNTITLMPELATATTAMINRLSNGTDTKPSPIG